MRLFGVDPWIISRSDHRRRFEMEYRGIDIPVIYCDGDVSGKAQTLLSARGILVDAIVATSCETFGWLPDVQCAAKFGYYVQDLETWMFADDKASFDRAALSYFTRPEVARVTSESWIRDEIVAAGGYEPIVIGPSVDIDLFYPRRDDEFDPKRPPHIVAKVRPDARRKGPDRTLRVLRRLKDTFKDAVAITCFAGSVGDISTLGVPLDGIRVLGTLAPGEVADLLGQTDIFLDFSDWQATGLTALEAMASGAAVVMPREGGASEFCRHGINGLVVDSRDEDARFEVTHRLVVDAELRLTVRRAGMETAMTLTPDGAALKLLEALWGAE